jgi:Tol biopolymer transport system component
MRRLGLCLMIGVICAASSSGAWAYDWEHIFGGPLPAGADAPGYWGQFSADGRYVTVWSLATNLIPDDTNGESDVFLYDRALHQWSRVSIASDGSQGNDESHGGGMSQDGRYVAFWSLASNLVPDDTNGVWDVFVRDRVLSQTFRVSVSSDGVPGNANSGTRVFGGPAGSISADGRYVVFSTASDNLVPGDTNGVSDVFVHDLQTRQTIRVSVASDGSQATKPVAGEFITADGRHVIMSGPGDCGLAPATGHAQDFYVHNLDTGETTLLDPGLNGDASAKVVGASGDGQVVAFSTDGGVWVWKQSENASAHVDTDPAGVVRGDSVSADGRIVTLHTNNNNDLGRCYGMVYDTFLNKVIDTVGYGSFIVSPSGDAFGYTVLRSPSEAERNDLWVIDTDDPRELLYSFGAVAGAVTAGGGPVADAEVWIDTYFWTKSDANGGYLFPKVRIDDGYSLTATSWGREGSALAVSVTQGETSAVDIALTPAFTDLPEGYWAESEILACTAAGIVRGYPNGTYDLDGAVTRDQMAVYVARALAGGDAQVPTGPEAASFTDVGTDHWAYRYIEYVASDEANVVQGYPGIQASFLS